MCIGVSPLSPSKFIKSFINRLKSSFFSNHAKKKSILLNELKMRKIIELPISDIACPFLILAFIYFSNNKLTISILPDRQALNRV